MRDGQTPDYWKMKLRDVEMNDVELLGSPRDLLDHEHVRREIVATLSSKAQRPWPGRNECRLRA
jgi:hypothetical protein